jgi:hypothetical protein
MRELERERRSKSLSASPGPSSCGASPVLVEACSGCQKQNVRACCVCWRVVVVMCVVCSSGVLVRLRARVLASEHQELGACVVTCVLWAAGRIVCGCACVAAACGSRLLWSCVRAACARAGCSPHAAARRYGARDRCGRPPQGSTSHAMTGMVRCTVGERGHLFLHYKWKRGTPSFLLYHGIGSISQYRPIAE